MKKRVTIHKAAPPRRMIIVREVQPEISLSKRVGKNYIKSQEPNRAEGNLKITNKSSNGASILFKIRCNRVDSYSIGVSYGLIDASHKFTLIPITLVDVSLYDEASDRIEVSKAFCPDSFHARILFLREQGKTDTGSSIQREIEYTWNYLKTYKPRSIFKVEQLGIDLEYLERSCSVDVDAMQKEFDIVSKLIGEPYSGRRGAQYNGALMCQRSSETKNEDVQSAHDIDQMENLASLEGELSNLRRLSVIYDVPLFVDFNQLIAIAKMRINILDKQLFTLGILRMRLQSEYLRVFEKRRRYKLRDYYLQKHKHDISYLALLFVMLFGFISGYFLFS